LLLNSFAELLICSSFEVLLRSSKQKKKNFSADVSFKSYGDPLIIAAVVISFEQQCGHQSVWRLAMRQCASKLKLLHLLELERSRLVVVASAPPHCHSAAARPQM
jgi:hypothetical protein